MKKLVWLLIITSNWLLLSVYCHATPSTQIWNPSTDIQSLNVWHLGIDNYFSVTDNKTNPINVPTDVNLTYGLCKNLEVGFDFYGANYFGAPNDPLQFNAKYGLPEGAVMPAIAVGGMDFGTQPNATDFDIVYAVIAKTFKPIGRFSVGYYSGNSKLLLDQNGASASTGAIVSWDKQISDKWWASIDCSTGNSWYGVTSFGGSYAFAPNTSVLIAYVIPNDPYAVNGYGNHMVTTQLDINF
jgi:hypothetical protein